MAVLARDKGYDRTRLMRRASDARKKRKHKKAIALYRQVLEVEPNNFELHQKLAPLLAQTRQGPEALVSYNKAAQGLVVQGFDDRAIGLYHAAVRSLPLEASLWLSLAELEAGRDRKADAVKALLDGRRHFRSRKQRPEAIQLLIRARKLERTNFAVNYDLACLLSKSGERPHALRLLDELAARANRRNLRRVRGRQLWIAPSGGGLMRYLRALLLGR
jgi:tetratricopeptide (TPR) repeat protein